MNEKLTIAIPTYNRNEILFKLVKKLIPLMTSEFYLLIIDNYSDTPVEATLTPILQNLSENQFQIIRNACNIGIVGNILRCFELCNTEWIWILGDDDGIYNNSLEIIKDNIEKYNNALYINFSPPPPLSRENDVISSGLRDFLTKIDIFPHQVWISSSVYKTDLIRNKLRFGYQFGYCLCPHTVALIMAIEDNTECVFSRDNINFFLPDTSHSWSRVYYPIGLPTILDIPIDFQNREILTKHLNSVASGYFQNAINFLSYGVEKSDINTGVFLYYTFCHRRLFFEKNNIKKIMAYLLLSLSKINPRALLWTLKFLVKKLKPNQYTNQELWVSQDDVSKSI